MSASLGGGFLLMNTKLAYCASCFLTQMKSSLKKFIFLSVRPKLTAANLRSADIPATIDPSARSDRPTFLSAPLLPAVLLLVALLLLLLPLSSHLLQLLPVFPLDEALLMSHLWEVIWRGGGRREAEEDK